jgi:hypothetical protein
MTKSHPILYIHLFRNPPNQNPSKKLMKYKVLFDTIRQIIEEAFRQENKITV